MKAQDLRLGNYINALEDYDQAIASQVIALSSGDADIDEYGNRILFYTLNGEYAPEQCTVEGIPITSDWLVRLGFEEGSDDYGFLDNDYSIEFIVLKDCMSVLFRYYDDSICFSLDHIKYVHQLQNLFFALTGKEITTS